MHFKLHKRKKPLTESVQSSGSFRAKQETESEGSSAVPSKGTENEVFRLMDLPLELRELIYYHATGPFPPIDTASIANTPDWVTIPPVAQLSPQTRHEALGVFYRNRPVMFSLHCQRNIERAKSWIDSCVSSPRVFNTIICSGSIWHCQGNFFHITIEYSPKTLRFHASARPGASEVTDHVCQTTKDEVQKYLNNQAANKTENEKGMLSADNLHDILHIMDTNGRFGRVDPRKVMV